MIDKKEKVQKLMQELNITENELLEKFVLGSGKGGQKVNKTSTCVYLKYIPTGLEVKCQKTRSREYNRYLARVKLFYEIKKQRIEKNKQKKQLLEKKKRQTRRGSRKGKEKMLKNKKIRSEKKALRQKLKIEN